MSRKRSVLSVLSLLVALSFVSVGSAADTLKIGFNIPLTGDIPKVGEGSKFAAEMLKEEVNGAGGLKVGDKTYQLEFIYEDNESKAESATAAALKLITQDQVLAIIGPQASKQAIPAGEVCDSYMTPMISPWSTNPQTTKDRPYVFRACFLDPFQGPVAAKFVSEEFGAKKAAVLYDIASDYPKGLAEYFKEAFEKIHGPGSVVAFETFTTKDRDFSAQLTNIIKSGADVLFTPQYYDEVPLIVKQAHELGWNKPIMGSDSWGSAELMTLCGDDCKGLFFSTHYAAAGAKGATKEFIEKYKAKYGYVPDDVAALTWDATRLLLQAIQETGGLTGNLDKDREMVKDALAKVKDFDGITGKMTFTPEGDPIKCAVIVKISDQGEFEFYKSVCP
ncbi:amino acid/amide ABC transporter substrate-binding protein, HAAT family (TC 3.A.1.4.-) [Desulfacinum infernum DSM 9756]|uniref:Amino acid/amide ABC transporter substrate-binding protein, HAAT family (TC 3.A.1.4.-) n=1 Tax=Desulfacinum infernum DSM 9756 TaxID=1121391 RepID=A0A1M5FPM4_9BACT|nr:ABC transporter substrate-binding protein [Desulfacinum infernum]SHF93132.1 amino acid/amide ABC transporter substrate-binding protein, HAAT family (TC 3.A.1.4.-) [Desulfacinum infernum DSM 9756]